MSSLPRGWVSATLGEVTAPRGEKANPSDLGDLPFVGLEEVEAHTGRIVRTQTTAGLKSAVALFGKGDLLYGRLRPYLNKVALVENDGAASAEFIVFPPSVAVDQSYLQRTLMSPDFVQFTGLRSTGDRPRVSFDAVSDYVLPLPPLAEQRRIVAKIDSLTGKSQSARDHLDHIPRLVEKYKQAVIAAAFRGDLTREWRLRQPKWRDVSVADVATLLFDGPFGSNLKSSDYTDQGVRVVRLENIGHMVFVEEKRTYISDAKYAGLKRHTLQPNDILVSSFVSDEMRVCLFPSNLGALAINKADCFCIRPDLEVVVPRFAELRLASSETFKALEEEVHGATRPRISLSQLRRLRFNLPTMEEQAEIVRRIDAAFIWIDRLASEATSARRLVDRLDQAVLAKAFRGELVPQDPEDEPASILLDRLRAARDAAPKARNRPSKRL